MLTPLYTEIGGFRLKSNNAHENVKHQVLTTSWGCKFEVGDCVENARKIFADWQNNMTTKEL